MREKTNNKGENEMEIKSLNNKTVADFYAFNDNDGQQISICKTLPLKTCHNLFNIELLNIKENRSLFEYIDITIEGRILRSYKKRRKNKI